STMVKIAHAIEPIIPYRDRLKKSIRSCTRTKNDAIGISVADTALAMKVAGIVAFTQSGNTARRIAKFRPQAPILAVTFDERTQRSLAANWGVTAIFSETVNTRENEASLARNIAMSYGIHKGETIIIVAGYPTGYGATNAMKIIEV
ncbi:MAG: pyruvate kinase alpha/beta domain-containing protein, partial [Merdibacter sp.]